MLTLTEAAARNPRAHDVADEDDPQEAAELILSANTLLRIPARVPGSTPATEPE